MLVVNWGDKTPVVYTLGARDVLDGEWADGTATERLTLHGGASQDPVTLREGIYRAAGRGANGTPYQGVVHIARQDDGYRIDWKIGKNEYKGKGALDGNLFSVDWGSATPIVYALAADGTLKGLWGAGMGEETLTPERCRSRGPLPRRSILDHRHRGLAVAGLQLQKQRAGVFDVALRAGFRRRLQRHGGRVGRPQMNTRALARRPMAARSIDVSVMREVLVALMRRWRVFEA